VRIVTDDRVPAFVGARVERRIVPPFTAAGIESAAGEIIAGAVFNGFTGNSIDVTIAGHGWTKGFIKEVGAYVYGQLGCVRMTVITEQPEVVRFAERLGGQIEGLLRNEYGAGRDGYLVGILREEWKF
jgi:RimJ/RimL family protein N-acetyltransferase